jgi:hypothetical protein
MTVTRICETCGKPFVPRPGLPDEPECGDCRPASVALDRDPGGALDVPAVWDGGASRASRRRAVRELS